MKTNQRFSFERNRYYSGKMLTSSDFQIEQEYVNDKRRFINYAMFGSGIVWGGSVYNLDDLSVMIESGAFIDSWGREIIIPQAEIRKLSAIEGFENVISERAYLCVAYDEEDINPMYAVRQGEEQLECNHIREGYRIFLIDEKDISENFSVESEFLTEGEIFGSKDYSLKIVMPATVCSETYVKIRFELKKKSDTKAEFSFSGTFQMPSFVTDMGEKEYFLEIKDSDLERGEIIKKELWVKAECNKPEKAKVILQPGTARAYIDGREAEIAENLVLDVEIDNIKPTKLINSIIGKTNLEMRTMVSASEYVCLARIDFKRTNQGYMISDIEEKSVKKYIESPADGALRSEFSEYFKPYEKKNINHVQKPVETTVKDNKPEVKIYEEGTFEIPLGKGAKRGEIFYSDEIACGMGDEIMYVRLGFDVSEENPGGMPYNVTIFGESDIFKEQNDKMFMYKSKKTEPPAAATAVKLYRDRGTFQAGIRFLKDYDNVILKCRWIAVRRAAASKASLRNVQKKPDGYISMEQSTLIMKPGESIYLQVKYTNMEACPLSYAVNEYGGGEVTENGIYTAPEAEGVYEINVYCTENPIINTFCFAVVRKQL